MKQVFLGGSSGVRVVDVPAPVEEPLRVLLVAPVSADDGGTTGGVATHVSDLVRHLAAAGHEVSVYADNLKVGKPSVRAWGTLYPPVASRAIPATAMTLPGGLSTLARAMVRARGLRMRHASAAAHALGLRRALVASAPDIVHYHHADTRPAFGRMAGVRVPSIITVHSVHSLPAFQDEVGSESLDPASRNLEAADGVIAVSDDVAGAITVRLPGVRPRVIPNSIDVAAFSAGDSVRPTEAPAGPLVLFLGRIATYKGALDLVEAMTAVRERVPGASLALVGPEIDLTRETLSESWAGPADALVVAEPLAQPAVVAWLHAADVLVMPSRVREGGGRVLLEAFAAGTPVVACDVGAVGAMLEHGALGALVEPGVPAALADAIVEALSGSEMTLLRTRAATEAVMTYDSAVLTEQVVDAYRAVIASRATR